MQINKGFTLSQFIKEVKHKEHDSTVCSFDSAQNIKLQWIYKYDLFLKQLVQEWMFTSENKIFKGEWKSMKDYSLGFDTIKVSNGVDLLEFYEDGSIIYMDRENYEYEVTTLYDLFEASKGKLDVDININCL